MLYIYKKNMKRQNVKSGKEKIIGIISFRIELDRNPNLIFSTDRAIPFFILIWDLMGMNLLLNLKEKKKVKKGYYKV